MCDRTRGYQGELLEALALAEVRPVQICGPDLLTVMEVVTLHMWRKENLNILYVTMCSEGSEDRVSKLNHKNGR